MTYTLKPEYVGDILEIIRYEVLDIKFDTNTADPNDYEMYYNQGFEWAFDVT